MTYKVVAYKTVANYQTMSGGDWSRIRADGSGALDVRLCLKTHDGAIILMTYGGRMVASAENFEYALSFSKPDDPLGAEERYYFRTNPLFETGQDLRNWHKARAGRQGKHI